MSDLSQQHCITPDEGLKALDESAVSAHLQEVDGWERDDTAPLIQREFRFQDFYQTIAFVNAVAWVANNEDHHPDLEVGYNRCRVHYTTHAVNGLSLNDFICAARINQLLR